MTTRIGQLFVVLITNAAVLSVLPATLPSAEPSTDTRPRIIATTDGEIDDRCSMVRFLLYANEWDIEGIIYCSSKFHWKGHNWAGEDWIERDIDLYASFYDNLKTHASGFPTPEYLKSVTHIGNIDDVGEMEKETPGSNHIVNVLLDSKPGPVYLQAWGGTNTIARALKTIQEKHPDEKKRVSDKAIIYIILDQDNTFRKYILPNWPDIQVLGSFRQFGCIAYGWRDAIPSSLHPYYNGHWMKNNILKNHGPLCARYEVHSDGRFRSEGDSPAFMHQIRTGLGSMAHPGYGGWGGRFEREEDAKNVWKGARDDGDRNKPIWRWSEDFQNDWAARADWCVRSFKDANHNPVVVVNGATGKDIVRVKAMPGEVVSLSADGSSDPDGDSLTYRWWYYTEPSSYSEEARIDDANNANARFTVPADRTDHEHHIILSVKDDGTPPLFGYRRVIVDSPGIVDDSPPSAPKGLVVTAGGETKAILRWEAAVDRQSGIRSYIIHRDGNSVAETKSTSFTDTGLREASDYAYQVSARNGCSVEGKKSAVAHVTTAPDETPPQIKSVWSSGKKVLLLFNEPVHREDAERLQNYSFDSRVQIIAAKLRDDDRTLVLETSELTDGETYTLAVQGVRDLAKQQNTMAAGGVAKFIYRTRSPLVRIGDSSGNSLVTLHGAIRKEADGSFYLREGEPWKWIGVGQDEAPLKSLEDLQSLTLLGWAKPESLATGSGGNRLVFNLNCNKSGFDLVHLRDGRLRLAVNEWPDRVVNDSSRGMLRKDRWVFFAVVYDSTTKENNVRWYFGDENKLAQLDRVSTYNKGATGKGSGPLTVGNYNTTIQGHGLDRQFRGWLRDVTIYGSKEGAEGALDLERIREHQHE